MALRPQSMGSAEASWALKRSSCLCSSARSSAASAPPPLPQRSSPVKSTRVYLQARLRAHSIWRNTQYWESALYDAIGADGPKGGKQQASAAAAALAARSSEGSSSGAAGAAASSSRGGLLSSAKASMAAAAESRREVDVLFGQLGFFAYTMVSFGLPEDS